MNKIENWIGAMLLIILVSSPNFAKAEVTDVSSKTVTLLNQIHQLQLLLYDLQRKQIYQKNVGGSVATPAFGNLPTCALTANQNPTHLGKEVSISWTTSGSEKQWWNQDDSGKDSLTLPEKTVKASGTRKMIMNVLGNPDVKLNVENKYGKGSCTVIIAVKNDDPEIIFKPNSKATINSRSLTTSSSKPEINGTSDTNGVYVQITNIASNIVEDGSGFVSVVNSKWSYRVKNKLLPGLYKVEVIGPENGATGTLKISS